MKLYERFTERGFHTSIVTTFGIDFDVYENAVLAKLQGSGCYNNILVADRRMITLALDDGYTMPKTAGKEYTVLGINPSSGVFHPKIILQLGRQSGQLLVSSANMTAPGIAGNLEIVGQVRCGVDESGEKQLISSAWQYVSRFLEEDKQALEQYNWILERTPWLEDFSEDNHAAVLEDGTHAAFFGANSKKGIFSRFESLISGEKVKRLIVMSPYWDDDLSTLHLLVKQLAPEETIVLVESKRGLFPTESTSSQMKLFDLQSFMGGRFVHAKALIAETSNADHIIYGSPNCTFAALGNMVRSGTNEEACFYRQMPPDTALSALKLKDFIVNSLSLTPSMMKPFIRQGGLDLKHATKRFPGRFEGRFDILTWWPSASFDIEDSKIILLNKEGTKIPVTYEVAERKDDSISYKISGTKERIAFARVYFLDGSLSAPAVILSIDHLRSETLREARTKITENILSGLFSNEDETLLDLSEIIDQLEAEESKDSQTKRAPRHWNNGATQPEKKYQILDYESFIASRQTQSGFTSSHSSNSLQGSSLSEVRSFLNRFLALESDIPEENTTDEKEIEKGLGLHEENPEYPSESGDSLHPKRNESSQFEILCSKKQRENREYFADSVQKFIEKIGYKSTHDGIASVDLLRLRSTLMIAAALGWTKNERKTTKVINTVSWPRTTGRILFSFFGGKNPAIRNLKADSFYNAVPTDYIECWATCIWVIQASLIRAQAENDSELIISNLKKLMESIYLLTALQKEELLAPSVIGLLQGMDRRFSQRLRIGSDIIMQKHHETVHRLLI